MTNETTLCSLLALSTKPLAVWLRRRLVAAELKSEELNLNYFLHQGEVARYGASDAQKRIMQLNAIMRDIGD